MNFSICLLDSGGRTQRTMFGPRDDDAAALAEAHLELAGSPIVEVWKDEQLLTRLFGEPQLEQSRP